MGLHYHAQHYGPMQEHDTDVVQLNKPPVQLYHIRGSRYDHPKKPNP